MNKILIIDDDRELCALIKRSVQAENIEADFCNTGKEGLQKLREQEYQLVVLDVMMPGMDGFETLEEKMCIRDRNKAHFSLDAEDGIEYSACFSNPSPQELIERMERFEISLPRSEQSARRTGPEGL